jgi:uncharacterized protein (DUF362 family)
LKPNVLISTSPDNGVTTHTAVFRAAASLPRRSGFNRKSTVGKIILKDLLTVDQ